MLLLAVIYTIEPYVWLKSMSTLGWKSEKLEKCSWVFFLGYYLLTLVKQYFSFSKGVGTEWTICFGVLVNLYMIFNLFWFKGTVRKKIYTIGLFYICAYLAEMVTVLFASGILHVPTSVLLNKGLINIVCTFLAKLLLIPVSYIIFRNKNKNVISQLYKVKELLPLIIFTLLFIIATAIIFCCGKFENMNLTNMIIVVLSQVLLLSTIFYITAILKKIKIELEQKNEIIRLTNSLDNLRHDMSSHVRMLKFYVKNKQYDNLEKYMNKTFADVEVAENVCALDNYAVAVTINSFLDEAQKKQINFSRSIVIQDFILPDNEICSLLSNILKNAIEAAEKAPEENRFVYLEIAPLKNGYFINCINGYQTIPNYENGQLQTTKGDKLNHGRGLTIIKNIVEKHNHGKVITHFEEDFFEINCEIYRKER